MNLSVILVVIAFIRSVVLYKYLKIGSNTVVIKTTELSQVSTFYIILKLLFTVLKHFITTQVIDRLRALYGEQSSRPDNLDLFTGGMLETTPEGPGELFQKIILDQFLRIRHGDRFWFENTETRYWCFKLFLLCTQRILIWSPICGYL